MFDPPHVFQRKMEALGRSKDSIANSLTQVNIATAAGLQPILTLGHLARTTEVSLAYLTKVIDRASMPYTSFELRKRSGGYREILSPEPDLMRVQRWLLAAALNLNDVHIDSYAYQPGRSALECARMHCGSRWLIKLDIVDFFGSIYENSVFRVFRGSGHRPLVAYQLARLSTWPYGQLGLGRLPQGAPTSGAVSNLVARKIDIRMSALARRFGLVYSRYADDLFLSTGRSEEPLHIRSIIGEADRLLATNGFVLNKKKVRVGRPGGPRIVLGVSVAGDEVALTRAFKIRLDSHLRGAGEFGLSSHRIDRGFTSIIGLVRHIDGLLAYAHAVDGAWATGRIEAWRAILSENGLIYERA